MEAYFERASGSGDFADRLVNQVRHNPKPASDSPNAKNWHSLMTKNDVSPLTWALYQASKTLAANGSDFGNNAMAEAATTMVTYHKEHPIILSPTTAETAPLITDPAVLPEYQDRLQNMEKVDTKNQMPLIYDAWLHGLTKTPFTQQANITDDPAISLPTYVSPKGLPLGIQFTAGLGEDKTLIALGKLFEQHQQFKMLHHSQSVPQPFPSLPVTVPQEVPGTTENPVTKPSQKPASSTPAMKTAKIKKVIYVTSKFDLYRDVTKRQVKKHYGKHSRRTAPSFKVTGLVTLPNGQKFYRVKQGYIRVAREYITNIISE